MTTVAGAVSDLARDRRYLGAAPGILMVLHTWTGQMHYHPHVHPLVTGGGVSDDGQSWRQPPGPFLVPVKALSKLIAARFRDALKKAKPDAFNRLPRKTWKQPWCSFSKHYGRGRKAVVDDLARYAFRIAFTNARIVAMDDTQVTFKYGSSAESLWVNWGSAPDPRICEAWAPVSEGGGTEPRKPACGIARRMPLRLSRTPDGGLEWAPGTGPTLCVPFGQLRRRGDEGRRHV